jgi:hypothetical protein
MLMDTPMTERSPERVPETSQMIAAGAARASMRAMSGMEFLRG